MHQIAEGDEDSEDLEGDDDADGVEQEEALVQELASELFGVCKDLGRTSFKDDDAMMFDLEEDPGGALLGTAGCGAGGGPPRSSVGENLHR